MLNLQVRLYNKYNIICGSEVDATVQKFCDKLRKYCLCCDCWSLKESTKNTLTMLTSTNKFIGYNLQVKIVKLFFMYIEQH